MNRSRGSATQSCADAWHSADVATSFTEASALEVMTAAQKDELRALSQSVINAIR
jgi:hypothetical protein